MLKCLAKVFLCLGLELAVLCGAPVTPEEIERILRLNQLPSIVETDMKDDK